MMGKVIMSGIVPPLVAPVTGILASDIAVGSSVYLMENGIAVEYLVVNQGIPSGSSLYDASCNGTWLLRKDLYENRRWNSTTVSQLESSEIQSYLNSTFLNFFDSDVQSCINQVKIPYRKVGTGAADCTGENGLSCKLFLLSGYEVGWTTSTNKYFPVDGAVLDYFKGTASTDSKRIANLSGNVWQWWLRSPYKNNVSYAWRVKTDGGYHYLSCTSTECGMRPALVLNRNVVFDEETLILKGVS